MRALQVPRIVLLGVMLAGAPAAALPLHGKTAGQALYLDSSPGFFPNVGASGGPSPLTLSGSNNCIATQLDAWTAAAAISDIEAVFVNAYDQSAATGEVTTGLGNVTFSTWVKTPGASAPQELLWAGKSNSGPWAPTLANFIRSSLNALGSGVGAYTHYFTCVTGCSSNQVVPAFAFESATNMVGPNSQTLQFQGSNDGNGDPSKNCGSFSGGSTTSPWLGPFLLLSSAPGGYGTGLLGQSTEDGYANTSCDALGECGLDMMSLYCPNLAMPCAAWTVMASSGHTASSVGPLEEGAFPYLRNLIARIGVGDINEGASGATDVASINKVTTIAVNNGARVFAPYLPPQTTSTDGFKTLTNQTPNTGFGVGQAVDTVNAAIAAGTGNAGGSGNIINYAGIDDGLDSGTNPGISGASVLTSSGFSGYPDSRVWGVNGVTSDWLTTGQHPSPYGYGIESQNVKSRIVTTGTFPAGTQLTP